MNANVLAAPDAGLNRNWQPVNVATVARALVLLWNEAARVVDVADYQTFSWSDWSKLRPRDDEAFVQAISMRLRVPEVIALSSYDRMPAVGRDVQPAQHLQARPLRVPVLRQPAGHGRADDRPRRAAVAGRRVELDELRAGLHDVQQAQGRPHAARGRHDAAAPADPADVEAGVRRPPRAARKLVEVRQRSVLERWNCRSK